MTVIGRDEFGSRSATSAADLTVRMDSALFEHLWLSLLTLATGLTGSRPAAEDLVQDVFEGATRLDRSFPTTAAAAAYLRTAVVHRARSLHRRERVRRAYLATLPRREPTAPSAADSLGEHAELLDALGRLRARQRAVLVLRYWCDLSDADIAACLGMAPAGVRVTAMRAQRTLAARLDGAHHAR